MLTVFEKIIAREIPTQFVYEDEYVVAFLDINPRSKGHTLIVPKNKFVNIFDADEKIIAHMMIVTKKIANALIIVTNATGVNLIMNNGKDAGQEVFHAHLHVIPRHANDHVFQNPKHTEYTEGEMYEIAIQMKNAIA